MGPKHAREMRAKRPRLDVNVAVLATRVEDQVAVDLVAPAEAVIEVEPGARQVEAKVPE